MGCGIHKAWCQLKWERYVFNCIVSYYSCYICVCWCFWLQFFTILFPNPPLPSDTHYYLGLESKELLQKHWFEEGCQKQSLSFIFLYVHLIGQKVLFWNVWSNWVDINYAQAHQGNWIVVIFWFKKSANFVTNLVVGKFCLAVILASKLFPPIMAQLPCLHLSMKAQFISHQVKTLVHKNLFLINFHLLKSIKEYWPSNFHTMLYFSQDFFSAPFPHNLTQHSKNVRLLLASYKRLQLSEEMAELGRRSPHQKLSDKKFKADIWVSA